MNAQIKIAAPGRKARFVRIVGADQRDFVRKAATHIRSLAASYGVSPLSVDYDVISD